MLHRNMRLLIQYGSQNRGPQSPTSLELHVDFNSEISDEMENGAPQWHASLTQLHKHTNTISHTHVYSAGV